MRNLLINLDRVNAGESDWRTNRISEYKLLVLECASEFLLILSSEVKECKYLSSRTIRSWLVYDLLVRNRLLFISLRYVDALNLLFCYFLALD